MPPEPLPYLGSHQYPAVNTRSEYDQEIPQSHTILEDSTLKILTLITKVV